MIECITGSGNVFEDLGFEHPEEMRAKARLFETIAGAIKDRRLTTHEAAQLLEADEAEIEGYINGMFDDAPPMEHFLRHLARLGHSVTIKVTPVAGRPRISVEIS